MSTRPNFILDLDDTLIATGELYRRVRDEFLACLQSEGFDIEQARQVFEGRENENTQLFGHDSNRYSVSMTETVERLCGGSAPNGLIGKVKQIGLRIHDEIPDLVVGAKEAISALRSMGEVSLISRGEQELQIKKIRHHELDAFFGEIKIVERKTVNEFREFVKRLQLDVSNTWVVGDSIQADINPALELGLKPILVPYPSLTYTWTQDQAVPISWRFFAARSLSQIHEIVLLEQTAALLALADDAFKALSHAYAPYSGFRVGASVRASDGTCYRGANVENASLSLTIDAEQSALVSALGSGNRSFAGVAIVASKDGTQPSHVMPCGKCRQWFSELLEPSTPIAVVGVRGVHIWRVTELLPEPFTSYA
ncbi:MAG: cytidine deaminase [Verrucomicrobiia bacterium]